MSTSQIGATTNDALTEISSTEIPPKNELLNIKNLRKEYLVSNFFGPKKFLQALRGISLHVNKGETLAIVGESGCGKSTLAKVLMKLESFQTGAINVDGQDLKSISSKNLVNHMQMVFQDPFSSLNPRRKIIDIVSEPLLIQGEANQLVKAKAVQVLQSVGLSENFHHRYPHMLSGGQRQRVGIARALMTSPSILICDEPVSALDVSVQAQVLNLLLDIQKEKNISLIFISHDLHVVRFISDRIAVMYLGSIVEEGSTQEIFNNPKHPYTQMLLDSIPRMEKNSDTNLHVTTKSFIANSELPSPLNPPSGCAFRNRCAWSTPQCAEQTPALVDGVACWNWQNYL